MKRVHALAFTAATLVLHGLACSTESETRSASPDTDDSSHDSDVTQTDAAESETQHVESSDAAASEGDPAPGLAGGDAPVIMVLEPEGGVSASGPSASDLPVAMLPEPESAASFLRGLNFGNRLDAPNEGEWGPKLSEQDFATVTERGFDHVRLPVRFSAHAGETAPFELDLAFIERVDWAIARAFDRDLSVVLDFQYYDQLMSSPAEHRERFLRLWAQIAEHYAGAPDALAFELLSEPRDALTPVYNALVADTLAIVRELHPERTVIVDTLDFARYQQLDALELPEDTNLVATVHLYSPELFTWQGAVWAGPEFGTKGIKFPGPPETPIEPVAAALASASAKQWFEDYNTLPEAENPLGHAALQHKIQALVDFRQERGIDVYIGEIGVTTHADEESRFRYLELLRTSAEAENIGWAVWDNNGADMAILGEAPGTWRDSIIDALIPPENP